MEPNEMFMDIPAYLVRGGITIKDLHFERRNCMFHVHMTQPSPNGGPEYVGTAESSNLDLALKAAYLELQRDRFGVDDEDDQEDRTAEIEHNRIIREGLQRD